MLDHFCLPVLYATGLLDRISGDQPYDKEDAERAPQVSNEVVTKVRKLMAEVA